MKSKYYLSCFERMLTTFVVSMLHLCKAKWRYSGLDLGHVCLSRKKLNDIKVISDN